jgi:hemerythrin-like domain-containing protein
LIFVMSIATRGQHASAMHATSRPDSHLSLQRLRTAVDFAESGVPQRVLLDVPARPALEVLLDEGAHHRALLGLERDGSRPCIAVAPRRARGRLAITELFEEDHARLDAIAKEMVREAEQGRARAVVLAHTFAEGLRRHITIEERVLFPVFEARTGLIMRGPTRLMRREHRALESYLVELETAADAYRVTPTRPEVRDALLRAERCLAAVVGDHNEKEEGALFPLIDRTSAPVERDDLLRKAILF